MVVVVPLTVKSPEIVTAPVAELAKTTVPEAFGRVITLSAVGSATSRVVSKAFAVAPSNLMFEPNWGFVVLSASMK